MPTVCMVHGVGYDTDHEIYHSKIAGFAKSFERSTGASTVLYPWLHPGSPPPDPRNSWLFEGMRNWMSGIIMDFAYVLYNIDALTLKLPLADMYIGHSAGAVIVATKTDKPQVLMGCPVQLIQNVRVCSNGSNILNLMHYRDPVAAPVSGAVNTVTYEPRLISFVNPLVAHTYYWSSAEVLKQCIAWYNKLVLPGMQKLAFAHEMLKRRSK